MLKYFLLWGGGVVNLTCEWMQINNFYQSASAEQHQNAVFTTT
jgi:hypothetical protein